MLHYRMNLATGKKEAKLLESLIFIFTEDLSIFLYRVSISISISKGVTPNESTIFI